MVVWLKTNEILFTVVNHLSTKPAFIYVAVYKF
jgi:hypothetical protein